MLLWSCHFSWKSCCGVYCKWRLYFADLLCGCLQGVFCRDGVVMCGVWFGWLAGCLVQRWWCDVWLACKMYFAEMVLWCLVGLQDVFCRNGGVMSPCVMFGWFAGCILQRWWCDVWLMMMMKWCLMSSDVRWHIRDKLWPMPKHGSIILYIHGNQKAR